MVRRPPRLVALLLFVVPTVLVAVALVMVLAMVPAVAVAVTAFVSPA
ncbi:hypothetical protein ABT297_26105 [Dactylosporangium sp. NPDC000555]